MTGLTGLEPSGAITRRSLLLAGAGVAATAAIPKVAIAAGKRVARPSHLDRSTREPLVGTVLETRNRGLDRVPLVLLKIGDPATSYGQNDKFLERSFSLVFRGPAGQPLADGTHILFVPGVGKIEIWFSSAHLTEEGWEYVAVFSNSRLRQRPPRKPRGRLSKRQRGEVKRGERAAEKARRAERKRRRREREEREALERDLSKG
jgi:Domain of unknown function (DUF6916)